jgi:hypothetical protein
MKNNFVKTLLCFLSVLLFQYNTNAQQIVEGLKQIFDIKMDDKGNAAVEVSMKLNASQWDNYKRSAMSNNNSILKKEMERALPKYYLTDFKYSEDQMERSYKVAFNVLGFATLGKGGKWETKLETKNPDVTKLSDREFVLTQNMTSNGVFINQTQKVHLPSNANNAKIEKDSFGNSIMTYSTSIGLMPRLITYGGILLILAGGWMIYRNQQKSTNKLRVVKEKEAAVA